MHEHLSGKVKSTSHRLPLLLIYWEGCLNQQDATRREKYLKSGSGKIYLKSRLLNFFENPTGWTFAATYYQLISVPPHIFHTDRERLIESEATTIQDIKQDDMFCIKNAFHYHLKQLSICRRMHCINVMNHDMFYKLKPTIRLVPSQYSFLHIWYGELL